jgi:AcrR family transcriptional regulator
MQECSSGADAVVRGGLRARKRARTAEAIHLAAAELVLEHGLDATTIEAISERADVSTRTFFNYFPSKEDAVLGIDDVAIAAELDKVRAYEGDPLIAVFDLIYDVFEAGGGRNHKAGLKRELVLAYPQLVTRQIVRVTALEDRLSEIVSGWLATDERFAADSEAERLDEAHVLLGICLASVRVSIRTWAGHSDLDPGGQPPASESASATAGPRTTYEHAITSLRTVMEKLR